MRGARAASLTCPDSFFLEASFSGVSRANLASSSARFSDMKFMLLIHDRPSSNALSASMVRLSARLFATCSNALIALDSVHFSMIAVARELGSQPQLLHLHL